MFCCVFLQIFHRFSSACLPHAHTHTRTWRAHTHARSQTFHSAHKAAAYSGWGRGSGCVAKLHDMLYVFVCSCCAASVALPLPLPTPSPLSHLFARSSAQLLDPPRCGCSIIFANPFGYVASNKFSSVLTAAPPTPPAALPPTPPSSAQALAKLFFLPSRRPASHLH